MRSLAASKEWLQPALLWTGILASLIHLATDRIAGNLVQGYDFAAQSMSDLSAIGSPARPLVVWLSAGATLLMLSFSVGVWRAGGEGFAPHVTAGLIAANATLGLVATIFFPTRYGERPEFATPGVLLMFLSVLCFVLAMIFGAAAFSGWIRIVSLGIPLSYVVLAVFRFATAGSGSSGVAASLIGTQERTMAFSYLLWVIALAVYLLLALKGGD